MEFNSKRGNNQAIDMEGMVISNIDTSNVSQEVLKFDVFCWLLVSANICNPDDTFA